MDIDEPLLGPGSFLTPRHIGSVAGSLHPVGYSLIPEIRLNEVDCVLVFSDLPAWRSLVDPTLAIHERVSAIETIFSEPDEIQVVENLSGEDAKVFIDVIDEVSTHSFLFSKE